jgi:hypothetical protein
MTSGRSERGRLGITQATVIAFASCFLAISPAAAEDAAPATPAAAATPAPATPAPANAQFDDYCAMDLAEGQTVKTDCSVNWTGDTVPLEFVEIHQPVRHLKKDGEYFVCTDFRKPGSQDEYYDIDFWVNQKTGKLEVDNVKMHKVPVQEDGIWTQVPRYTFDGMDFEETN